MYDIYNFVSKSYIYDMHDDIFNILKCNDIHKLEKHATDGVVNYWCQTESVQRRVSIV